MAEKDDAGETTARFINSDTLRSWLQTQPREVSTLIAARAALRVLPLAASEFPEIGDAAGERRFTKSTAALFRMTASTWVAGKYPARKVEFRPEDLLNAATAAQSAAAINTIPLKGYDESASSHANVAAAQTVAVPVNSSAKVAVALAVSVVAQAAAAVTHAAAATRANAAAANLAAWAAVSADTALFLAEDSVRSLAEQPLWPGGSAPEWVEAQWQRLRAALPKAQGWAVWTKWYQDRLNGGALSEEIEFVYASVPPEKWDEGAVAANAWIAAELEKLKPQWTQTLSTLIEAPLGNRWTLRNDHFRIDPRGDESDIAAAREPVTRQLYQAIQRKAEAFAKLCAGGDDRHGWSGLEAAVARFHEEVSRDIDEIPEFIASVYDATVELGSFLDLDNAIRAAKNTNASPLDPEVRRAFSDLIRTAAPWVRGFPTARELDDQTGAFLARTDLFEPASRILAGASAQSLISDNDRDLILALLAAIEREGFVSHKAGVRGVQSVNNLTLKSLAFLAAFYSGAISSSYSNESPIIKKISAFLVAGEVQITKILADAPADVRLALKAALDDLKRRPPVDIPPPIDGIAPSAQKK